MKNYQAIIKGMNVITVMAENEEDAIDRIADQLQRPGRYGIYTAWVSDGKQIREKPRPTQN